MEAKAPGEGFEFRVTIPEDSSNRNSLFHFIVGIRESHYLAFWNRERVGSYIKIE
jgi:hypothetical protein